MNSQPRLICAKDVPDLLNQVLYANGNGEDMSSALFVDDGILCQWVISMRCHYEYRLIEAADLHEYQLIVRNLSLLGFEMMFNPVRWNGKLVQWMSRYSALTLDARHVKGLTLPADGGGLLAVVEGVRADLQLVSESPVALMIPFMTEPEVVELGEQYLKNYGTNIPDILLVDGVPLR